MITEQEAVALMAEANPVPDLAAYDVATVDAPPDLAGFERRSSQMAPLKTKPGIARTKQRSSMRWLAVAAVVLVGIALWSQLRDEPTSSQVAAISLNGASDDAAAVEAFAAVETAYAAYNSGDDAWVDIRSRGGLESSQAVEARARETNVRIFEAEQAADGNIAVAQCEWHGSGEWPDVVDRGVPAAVGHLFTCEATRTDLLHEAAGMQLAESYQWVVADGGVVAVSSSEDILWWTGFVGDFRRWLQETHPDADVTFLRSTDGAIFFPEAASVPTALEYVDEFVASRS